MGTICLCRWCLSTGLPAVVFRLFTTNFQAVAEGNHQIETLTVSFSQSLVILLVINNRESVLNTPYGYPDPRAAADCVRQVAQKRFHG